MKSSAALNVSTCAAAGAPSYLALLPAALRELVEQLIALNAWRWSQTITELKLPPLTGRWASEKLIVLLSGEEIVLRQVSSSARRSTKRAFRRTQATESSAPHLMFATRGIVSLLTALSDTSMVRVP